MAPSTLSLPPEVLSDIICLARPRRQLRHIIPFEVAVSHLSSDWRTAALSDSRLWTTVEVFSPKSIPRVLAYILRCGTSQTINLRIEIHDFDHHVKEESERDSFLHSVSAIIHACIHRCQTLLLFTCYESTIARILASLTSVAAPSLERVRINSAISNEELGIPTCKRSLILTQGCPSLRFFEVEALPTFPPLQNLATLHLHNLKDSWFHYEAFIRIAEQVPNLENLSLRTQGFTSSWPTHNVAPSVTMGNLRALRISDDEYPGLLVKFLLSLDAPRLESLWLCGLATNFGPLFDSAQFTHRDHKFSQLKYLTLESFNMHGIDKFGRAFPNITHLHLPYAMLYYYGLFVAALARAPPVWPQLDTLILTTAQQFRMPKLKEGLCAILPRRAELAAPLRKFLTDGDVLDYLISQKSDLLAEYLVMEEMDTDNYREQWWLMAHEETMDKIGLC